jgi:hypothetical protein
MVGEGGERRRNGFKITLCPANLIRTREIPQLATNPQQIEEVRPENFYDSNNQSQQWIPPRLQ